MNGQITFKSHNGMLESRRPIGKLLQEKLGPYASKRLAKTIRFAKHNNWVFYEPELLDDRELDDKLARDLGRIIELPHPLDLPAKVTICHPKTVLSLRDFKSKPVKLAQAYCYDDVTGSLFAPSQPADFRRKWYEIFNHALDVDERAKDINKSAFNLSLFLPSLFIGLNDQGEACRKLADRLWFDPKHDEGQLFDWLTYNCMEPENGTFSETPYYNDKRLIDLLNALMIENRDLLFKGQKIDTPTKNKGDFLPFITKNGRGGPHKPHFKKTG
jgi:hypothetical protein